MCIYMYILIHRVIMRINTNTGSDICMFIGILYAHAGVCACMRGEFPWLRPVRPHVFPWLRGGRSLHARAVRGRRIDDTKVKALPESLGQCKLLEELCVAPAAPPPCAFAAVPALRCCACAAAPGAGLRHAALDAAAAVLSVVGRAARGPVRPHVRPWLCSGRRTRARCAAGPSPTRR
jgi:hypothetical protein